MALVYLDNNATTRTAPAAVEAMLPYFSDLYGNPSSMYPFAAEAAKAVAKARGQVAALFGCAPGEVIFTSCGTESDNTAIWAALRGQPDKKHVVTSAVEHPAIMNNARFLRAHGYTVTEVGVDKQGNILWDDFLKALTPDTALATFMWANNETGVVFPVKKMAEACHERGIVFHTDAVQVAGKIPMDLAKSAIDMASISGHKFNAPKGVGALYVKKGLKFAPWMIGGHQERARRGGTENVPYMVAMGVAAELAVGHLADEAGRVAALRDRLEQGLLAAIPYSQVNGDRRNRVPNTTNVSFACVEGEAILLRLADHGLCASSGSACTSGSLEPSHVMRAMGVPFTLAHSSIRLSLSVDNTAADIDLALRAFPPIIEELRAMSPFWRDGRPLDDNPLAEGECGACQACGGR